MLAIFVAWSLGVSLGSLLGFGLPDHQLLLDACVVAFLAQREGALLGVVLGLALPDYQRKRMCCLSLLDFKLPAQIIS